MIIKELLLTSFGKFKNKSLELQDGINVIYGDNEAGKTTIHKFIEGMLYGFFKPYTKRKIYTDDYDKYMPWNQSDYFGILKYAIDGEIYKIERNFIKSNDEVKIYDDKTGEDISHMFEYDNTIRLHQPTSLHLDLNAIVYNNTISVKQLGNKTEDDLAKEVKDSLINLGRSLDEDISVKNIMEKLDKKIDFIGTKGRVKTSPYGKVVRELEKLESEKKRAVKVHKGIKENQIESNKIKREINDLRYKQGKLEENLLMIDGYRLKERYNEAVKLKREMESLDSQANKLKTYDRLDSQQYTKGIEIKSTISNLKENLESVEGKNIERSLKLRNLDKGLEKLKDFKELDEDESKEEIESLVSNFNMLQEREKDKVHLTKKAEELEEKINIIDQNDLSEINGDFYEYESLEQQKNGLTYDKDYTNNDFLKTRLEEKEKSLKRVSTYGKIALVLGVIPPVIGYIVNPLLYLTIIIPIIILGYSQITSMEFKKYIKKVRRQIFEVESQEVTRREKISNLNNKMENILKKHDCNSKGQLRLMINEYSMECALIKDKKDSLNSVKKEIKNTEEEIQFYKRLINRYLKYLWDDCEVTLENIKEFKDRYEKYRELKKEEQVIKDYVEKNLAEKEQLEERYNRLRNEMTRIFEENKVKDLKEFQLGLEKKKEYETILKERENKSELIKKVIGDNSLEFLRKKSQKYDDIDEGEFTNRDKDSLKTNLKYIHRCIREKEEELTRLEERIKNLEDSTRELVEIDEEIKRKEKTKVSYENKLKSLNIAKESINSISKEIQRDFAPKLNKKVGNIINTISKGKYSEVKITEKLDIKVTDPDTEKLISINSLSGGTIDQLYFATRLGIISIIREEENIPLILDDCFTQYDVKRLEGIIRFLANEGGKRQIILFTCHHREKVLLDKMDVKYNYIHL